MSGADCSRFTLQLEVRDYECDIEGIVNNAVYLHYLEHARHQFLKSVGLDFAELTRSGLHLVVVRMEVDYLASLRSGDVFVVELDVERASRIRVAFRQAIYRLPERMPMLQALVIATAVGSNGKPCMPPELAAAIGGS